MIINGKEIHLKYDYVKAVALHGSGTSGGKERIQYFFNRNTDEKDRINFVAHEYGSGMYGFGSPRRHALFLKGMTCTVKNIEVEYCDGSREVMEKVLTYKELVRKIAELIDTGEYLEGRVYEIKKGNTKCST